MQTTRFINARKGKIRARDRVAAGVLARIGLVLISGSLAYTPSQALLAGTNQARTTTQKETRVAKHASGPFDVKITPQTDDKVGDPTVGRMAIDKQYHGDIEGTGKGQMLATMGDVEGSGSYVALERVSGTVGGRSGTFALAHSGTMTRGTQQLNIIVVPDSGTGELAGITGKMNIKIVDGKHFYEFEYTLAESH